MKNSREIKKGTVCRVIDDSDDFFQTGDIVVTIEDSCVPYCCLEKHYNPRYSFKDYYRDQFNPLLSTELEELYDWSEK